MRTSFLVICVFLFAASVQTAPAPRPPPPPSDHTLLYERVHVVDNVGDNWLFRGNMPKNTTETFGYDQLMEFLGKRAEGSLPRDFDLFVISLGSLYNQADTDIEIEFFKAHPELGRFENWSLYHRYPNPFPMSDEEIKQDLQDPELWGKDDIVGRVSKLRTLMTTKGSKPIVIYFHCETGCDRTGEISAAYQMHYSSSDRKSVDEFNEKSCGRVTNPSAEYAIGWYCFYLTFNESVDPCCKCIPGPVDYSSIIFTGIFLDEPSRNRLMEAYPPELVNIFVEHSTIVYKPKPFQVETLPWGKVVNMTVVGYGNDGKAQAVVIRASEDLHSTNKITHITISTAKGVGAVWSNDMLAKGYKTVIDGPVLQGKVGAFVQDKGIVYKLPK